MNIFLADRKLNVSPAYLRPGFAFGGTCLPKDLRGLVYAARQADVSVPILENILPSNDEHIRRAFEIVTEFNHKRIGLFGLAFKEGTDDLREVHWLSWRSVFSARVTSFVSTTRTYRCPGCSERTEIS